MYGKNSGQMTAGVIQFSFSSATDTTIYPKQLSKDSKNFCRAAGNFVNAGFNVRQLEAIRQQFNSIVFYQIDQSFDSSPSPFQSYADKGTLRVFVPKISDENILLKFVISGLMVVALRKLLSQETEQTSAVEEATDGFLTALSRTDLPIPQESFPGLSFNDGPSVFQKVVHQIAQNQANNHLPIVESSNWAENEWDPDQLKSLTLCARWKYSKKPLFDELLLKKDVVLAFPIPTFQTDHFPKVSSPIVRSLQSLLRVRAINSLFDPLKRDYKADDAAIFINGTEEGTFLTFPWGERKVLVLYAGGFNGDLAYDFRKLLEIFRQKYRFAIPYKMKAQELSERNWRIYYPAHIQDVEKNLLGTLKAIMSDPDAQELAAAIEVSALYDQLKIAFDYPDEQQLTREAEVLHEQIVMKAKRK